MILKVFGCSALSAFRTEKLTADARKIDAEIVRVNAQFIYFVDLARDLTFDERAILDRILQSQPQSFVLGERIIGFLVIPRLGTISPWSSKATDIANHCGLTVVRRVERGISYTVQFASSRRVRNRSGDPLLALFHDPMTQQVVVGDVAIDLFEDHSPRPLQRIRILENGRIALEEANIQLGMALSDDEIDYLVERFSNFNRNPTDVELMMFAQVNSEHCRHKIFNAQWRIDGIEQKETLFGMIRNTTEKSGRGVLSAYKDNAAVLAGPVSEFFFRDPLTGKYGYSEEKTAILMKVETHNHPTAISPFPGAATGSGGEIRDETATGRGAMPKAGLCGLSVSHLKIPGFVQTWEIDYGMPKRIASALRIMIEGPLGAATFNNEFGRPCLAGFFRTFEQPVDAKRGDRYFGFHKPIMIAGGMGNVRPSLITKKSIPPGAPILLLGGPGMLIGLGGGTASSQASGSGSETLDFASVQRENPEMQRRCQEVINQCNALGESSPIISIHDVGAGGLANAIPEIIHASERGGEFELRFIPNADLSLSPLQIWCNESQERFVLAVYPERLEQFREFCRRECCPYAVLGRATGDEQLRVHDRYIGVDCIDIPMSLLFGKAPKMIREARRSPQPQIRQFHTNDIDLAEAVRKVLRFPAVADKSFLTTIGDRSVTGLVARDQMVGPWQIAAADVAVTASGFRGNTGEAMAMGERSPLAVTNAPASGRMAIGEALTNLAAARIASLSQVKLSANWMAASGCSNQDSALFETVKAVGMEFCPALGIAIPVGKDSLSMKTVWTEGNIEKSMLSPVSLVVAAFAPVTDIRGTLTPELRRDRGDTRLLLIDLGCGKNRLGGSSLGQVFLKVGGKTPDLDDPKLFKSFFEVVQRLNEQRRLLAYHDRSDGGLLASLCEMAFSGRTGLKIELDSLGADPLASLFNEELGAVIQIRQVELETVMELLSRAGLGGCVHDIGTFDGDGTIAFSFQEKTLFLSSRAELQCHWSETSYRMQALRDNPECARLWFENIHDEDDRGLNAALTFSFMDDISAPYYNHTRPKVAILRERGINGHVEMAAAFDQAGFDCYDVHMSDILEARVNLKDFIGIAACGGFSYGDVLGAGGGWANSILFNPQLRDQFSEFFCRADTFGLGVCNGCQMLSRLKELIAGAEHWPVFKKNRSEQFEARVVLVEVKETPSVFFDGMAGTRVPISVAHGEGQAEFAVDPGTVLRQNLVALQFVDSNGRVTDRFPRNPNGSPLGITGLTTVDGRFTIMMPHPERCFRTVQNSWHPPEWGEFGPWLQIFRNARVWVN